MGLTTKPKTPRQKRKPQSKSKSKNLTAKPNTFTAKAKFSRQNQMSHGKIKNLTAKPNRATAEVTSSFPVPSYWKGKTDGRAPFPKSGW